MTGFWPSDLDNITRLPINVDNSKVDPWGVVRTFGFDNLSKEPELVTVLAEFVLEYTFTGKIRGLSGPKGQAMVECGVSRFKKHVAETAETDEPLAILALINWLKKTEKLSLEQYLIRSLNLPDAASRGIVFEVFGAYLLSQKTKDSDSPTCSDPAMRAKMEKAIKELGTGTKKAGRCGLLRVLVSHPSLPHSGKLEDPAKGTHPPATVALHNLVQCDSALGQCIQSLADLSLRTLPAKRSLSADSDGADSDGARSKRRRTGPDTMIGGHTDRSDIAGFATGAVTRSRGREGFPLHGVGITSGKGCGRGV